jgi:hypothetical protein
MLDRAEGERVSVSWLMHELGERSFGLTLLGMAVVAFVPGASTFIGLLIAWPSMQLILGHEAAVLPPLVSRREVSVERLARIVAIAAPWLAWTERLIRPRWPGFFQLTRRLTGAAMLLLGMTLVLPLPFTQVAPALIIILLALADVEEVGCVLLLALLAALCWLAVTGIVVWGTVETIDWLDPATVR